MRYSDRAATAFNAGRRLAIRGIDATSYLRTYSTTTERMAFIAGYNDGLKVVEQEWRKTNERRSHV